METVEDFVARLPPTLGMRSLRPAAEVAWHECAHASAALALGLDVVHIVFRPADEPDCAAYTHLSVPVGRVPPQVIAAPLVALGGSVGPLRDDLWHLEAACAAAGAPPGWWGALFSLTRRLIDRPDYRRVWSRLVAAAVQEGDLDRERIAQIAAQALGSQDAAISGEAVEPKGELGRLSPGASRALSRGIPPEPAALADLLAVLRGRLTTLRQLYPEAYQVAYSTGSGPEVKRSLAAMDPTGNIVASELGERLREQLVGAGKLLVVADGASRRALAIVARAAVIEPTALLPGSEHWTEADAREAESRAWGVRRLREV